MWKLSHFPELLRQIKCNRVGIRCFVSKNLASTFFMLKPDATLFIFTCICYCMWYTRARSSVKSKLSSCIQVDHYITRLPWDVAVFRIQLTTWWKRERRAIVSSPIWHRSSLRMNQWADLHAILHSVVRCKNSVWYWLSTISRTL